MSFYKAEFEVVREDRFLYVYRNGKVIAKYEYYKGKWTMVSCRDMKYYFRLERALHKLDG